MVIASVLVLPAGLGGCYAGIVGAVLGIRALSSDSASDIDDPPAVRQLAVAPLESPDRILVQFRLSNDDEGDLGARVEFHEVAEDTAASPASPAPDSDPLFPIRSDEVVRFVWDAALDLGGGASRVRLVVTPVEDGTAGEPFETEPFRAGNTPLEIRDLGIVTARDEVTLVFTLVDDEEDDLQNAPDLVRAELSIEKGPFVVVPLPFPPAFASSPDGRTASVSLAVSTIADAGAELAVIASPGFIGNLCARLSVRDYPTEKWSSREACGVFDNNEPPVAQLVPTPASTLDSGVVPIRYRLLDPEENAANVRIEVDTGDGEGFRPANELALPISDGTRGLQSIHPDAGTPRFHTFLWDAASQVRKDGLVTVQITPEDLERGTPSPLFLELRNPWLTTTRLEAGTPSSFPDVSPVLHGDFNGDGLQDLLVLDEPAGVVDYLAGGPEAPRKVRTLPAGRSPSIAATGDVDGDGHDDAVVASRREDGLVVLAGSPEGLLATGESRPLAFAWSIASADFDGDGYDDVLVSRATTPVSVVRWRGSPGGLSETHEELGLSGAGTGTTLTTGFYDGDEYPDAVLLNQGPNQTLAEVFFLRGNPEGLVSPAEPLSLADVCPWQLVTADFDGDGRDDVAAVGWCGVVARLAVVGNAFERRETSSFGQFTQYAAAADFDGDGIADLAVTKPADEQGLLRTVVTLRGSENGLSGPEPIDVDGVAPVGVAAGDHDGDGFGDFLSGNSATLDASFLRGGAEGFQRPIRFAAEGVAGGKSALSADFDGDGLAETVILGTPGGITYYDAPRSGLSRNAFDFPVGSFPRALAVADLDGDGLDDVLVANRDSNDVTWLRSASEGLAHAASIPVGAGPVRVSTGDFDGDALLDAAVLAEAGDQLTVLPNDLFRDRAGVGEAAAPRAFDVAARPLAMAVADLDGDAADDIAVASFEAATITVFLSSDVFDHARAIEIGEGPIDVVIGDFDRDGSPDLVSAGFHAGGVSFMRNPANHLDGEAEAIATRRAPLALCAADLDADGFTDVAVAHFEGDVPAGATSAEFRVTVLHGSPDGLASRRDDVVVGSFPRAITSADFDGDGFTDLAVACSGDGTVYAVPGGPLGVVLPAHVSRAGRSPRALTSADFDGDGFFDLAVADVESSRIHLLRGGKEGLALEGDASRVSSGPASIGSGDFDGDGFLDVATASTSWNTVSVLSQRFLVPHATAVIAPEDGALGLDDPRSPPSYRLELAPGAFAETSRVSVLPATVFPPGPNETTGRATYLRVETYAARILREGAKPRSTARLTLLLRRELPPEDFALLEVYRKHPSTGRRVLDEPATRALEPHELSGRPAVRFPIAEFGTYLVAAVRTRE